MDAAARHVRTADLSRLAGLRARREEAAFRELRARAAARAAAEAAHAQAGEEVAAREAERHAGERALYDGLCAGGAIGLAALAMRQSRLDDLAGAVAAARDAWADRERWAGEAGAAHETARGVHAARARATRKWDAARARILAARRGGVERAEEGEAEDETQMRIGRVRA